MKKKTETEHKVVGHIIGTGEGYETPADALEIFKEQLEDFRVPGCHLPPEWRSTKEEDEKPINVFTRSLILLMSAFDAANKAVDVEGNGKDVINRILREVLVLPEIVKAIDYVIELPVKMVEDCIDAIYRASASGGEVHSPIYGDILLEFKEEIENELLDKIAESSGAEKSRLERELFQRRFDMFSWYFNGHVNNLCEGFEKFIIRTPLAPLVFLCGIHIAEDERGGYSYIEGHVGREVFRPSRLLCSFCPDENGKLNIPFYGGGGCRSNDIFLSAFSRRLKKWLGIDEKPLVREIEPKGKTDAIKAVSDYAARFVKNFRTDENEGFTFVRADGAKYDIDFEDAKLCHVKLLKRLISGGECGGWVALNNPPEWLRHRSKLPKCVAPVFECVEKWLKDGVSMYRITGEVQEWARGAPEKRPLKK